MGASSAVANLLRFGQQAILARILLKEEFGLASMAMVVVAFAQEFADFGISNALIQREKTTRNELSTLYWTNYLAGISVFAVVFLCTEPIARFFGDDRLLPIIPWTAVAFLITPLGAQFRAMLQKELLFKTVAVIEVVAALAAAVATIALAKLGHGVFSLIWGHLVLTATAALAFFTVGWRRWRPRLHFERSDLDGYLGFGMYQMGQATLGQIATSLDRVIVGRYLGAEAAGVYWLAHQLVILPLRRIVPVLNRVAFPVLSKLQSDVDASRRGVLGLTRTIAFVICPILVGMAVTAPILVPLIFGPGWDQTVVLVQILVAVGIAKALGGSFVSGVLAKGRAGVLFWWMASVAVTNAVVFWYFSRFGLYPLALSNAALAVARFIPIVILIRVLLKIPAGKYLSALLTPLALSFAMGLTVYAARIGLGGTALPALVKLGLLTAVGAAAYAALALLFQREHLRVVRAMLFDRRG